ncbi:hypothetical protein COV12_01570 [Candidatus Woesearchaeota archaeon CG10_big_fil_rev_8_21_14_0_10_32_24]|nr:MAG: hypothetical protein COV12_01570 [Candidatus Woesearchaeota archaeon CG10_big_fil_rev_8_21_14_0_10_32_24]
MAYTLRKKQYCVKQALLGLTPISAICRNRKVPRRTLYRWIDRYKQYGQLGLENKNPGVTKTKIKHILGRVHHPQTNGKIERWFGTYKTEYDERFNCLDEFVKFYNEIRIHQGINYTKPT